MIVLDRTYDPILKGWFNVVGKPANANALNNCVKALRNAGILAELDLFHLIGGLDTDAQRLRPLVTTSATKTFTAVASPTLAYNGVTGNGSSSYLDTGWNPFMNGVKYTRDSSSIYSYSRTNLNQGSTDFGHAQANIVPNNGGSFFGRINDGSADSISNSDSRGLMSVVRTGTSLKWIYKNGALLTSTTTASSSLNNFSFFFGARNNSGTANGFSSRNLSFLSVGSGNIDQLKFYNIIQTYMREVGLAV